MFEKVSTPSYGLDPDGGFEMILDEPTLFCVVAQTARNDAWVELLPGRYPMTPVTIAYAVTDDIESAYYFRGDFYGRLRSGGFPEQRPDDIVLVHVAPYAYHVRAMAAA